jgi:hypothetical protein
VLADSEMIVGDGTTNPAAESGATLRTSIGVGTGDTLTLNGLIFDNETLDIYDEGTFSPIYRPYSTVFDSITYDSIRYGRYVIIGHTCHFEWNIRTDAITVGSGSGAMYIFGMPVAGHLLANHYRGYVVQPGSASFAGEFPSRFILSSNDTYGELKFNADTTTAATSLAITDMDTGANKNWCFCTGQYETD